MRIGIQNQHVNAFKRVSNTLIPSRKKKAEKEKYKVRSATRKLHYIKPSTMNSLTP